MAKYIRITPELKEECRRDFHAELEKALATKKFSDGKLSFTKSFGTVNRKAKIYFTEAAWLKTTCLLREFGKEVAWHATAYRVPGDKDEYLIRDVLVYPQTVTSATVDMDIEKYAQWIQEGIMAGDERFDHIYCQMHSHVNMGVFASGTDIQHQEEILEQLGDDDFYIFMIWNKSLNVYMRIFDMQKNVLFESSDCEWAVLDDAIGLTKFLSDAKKLVKEQTYSNNYSQGYGRSPNYTPPNYGSPYNPASKSDTGVSGAGSASEHNKGANYGGASGKGKNSKKDKKKTKFTPGKNACDEGKLSVVTASGEEFDQSDPFGYYDGPFLLT